jgi:hypothetical protein
LVIKICFTYFITKQAFLKKKKKGSTILKYRRLQKESRFQENQEKTTQQKIKPDDLQWESIKKMEQQQKEREERKYTECQDSRQSSENILSTYKLPQTHIQYHFQQQSTPCPELIELKQKLDDAIKAQQWPNNPQWRKIFPTSNNRKEQTEAVEIKRLKWLQGGPLIIQLKTAKEDKEFMESKFYKQLR